MEQETASLQNAVLKRLKVSRMQAMKRGKGGWELRSGGEERGGGVFKGFGEERGWWGFQGFGEGWRGVEGEIEEGVRGAGEQTG